MRWPSIQVGDQPVHGFSPIRTAAPSASRRGTARISAMVMSAVSSVSTPGVLVIVMPRWSAVATSILSTPLPKLAIKRSLSPALLRIEASMRSVTVGTSTSAVFTASARSAWLIGLSSRLSCASNSSRMRVSTRSGSFRVITTSGFLLLAISHPRRGKTALFAVFLKTVQGSLTVPADTASPDLQEAEFSVPLYQMVR